MTFRSDSRAISLFALFLASCSNGDSSNGAATSGSVTTGAPVTTGSTTTGASGPGGTSAGPAGPGSMSAPGSVFGPGGTEPGMSSTGPGMIATGPGMIATGPGMIATGPGAGGTQPGTGGSESGMGGSELGASGMGGTAPGTGGMVSGAGGEAGSAGGSAGVSASGGASTAGAGGTGTGEPEFHIYLALGQSNMQGAAHLPDEPIFHERVMVLQGQNCSEHSIPYGEWREHFQPMIRCQEGMREKPDGSMGPIGLSPADTFAVTMADAAGPNVTIGIVGAAYGGTDIQAHLPDCGSSCTPPYGDVSGAPVVNGTTPIYEWILDLATKAQEVGVIKGIIFHHGESNSGDPNWLTHVNTYITSLRDDLGLDPAEVPFIAGELPRTGCCPDHNSLVQQIPDYVENGHWVSSGPMEDGTVLGDRSDALHWSTFSVIEMGKRYAEKMLEVTTSP